MTDDWQTCIGMAERFGYPRASFRPAMTTPAPTDDRSTKQPGLLLLNLGTPASTSVTDVRKYLSVFLGDPLVIDIPAPLRWLLLHAIILRKRPAESAKAYQKIWTNRGSPLMFHSEDLTAKVRERTEMPVALAMRYLEPSIEGALRELIDQGADEIILLPLYPQFSDSAWQSSLIAVETALQKTPNAPTLRVVPPFYEHDAFLDCFAAKIHPFLDEFEPDAVLLSFHGIPEHHLYKTDASGKHCLQLETCCDSIHDVNRKCYRAQCYATARGLAKRLGRDDLVISFQSRMGRKPWIKPWTDEVIRELAAAGKKRIVVACPAFVADCLETLEEIAMRLRDDFRRAGGEQLWLVPSLNSDDSWADAVLALTADAQTVSQVHHR